MYSFGDGWECSELQPGAGRPAAYSSFRGPGCVCEGATGDEPKVGRPTADTSRRDFKRGVRRLPQVWQFVCIVAGGHIDQLCKERAFKNKSF